MTNRRLDDKDRALLAYLQANAREPVAALGRKLGLARSTVQERIARLERDGVIAGYGVRLGPRADGRPSLGAQVSLSVDPKQADRVVRALKAFPEAAACHAVSGAFDLIVTLRASDMAAMDAALDRIGALPGVVRTTSSIVLATKFARE